jgi:hypothetical protein
MAKKRNPLVTAMNGGIANAKQTAKTFREMQTMLLGVKSMMRMKYGWVFDKVDESAETYLYASWSHFRNKPEISISMHRLESFKDKRLTDLLYNLCGFTDPVVSEYAKRLTCEIHQRDLPQSENRHEAG